MNILKCHGFGFSSHRFGQNQKIGPSFSQHQSTATQHDLDLSGGIIYVYIYILYYIIYIYHIYIYIIYILYLLYLLYLLYIYIIYANSSMGKQLNIWDAGTKESELLSFSLCRFKELRTWMKFWWNAAAPFWACTATALLNQYGFGRFPQLPQLHSFTSRQRAAPNNSEETRIESCWIYSIFTYLHIICNIQRELAVEVSWTRWLKYLKSHLHLKAPKIHKTWVWVNTYRYILVGWCGMNIHLPAILGFTRYQGFDPSPLDGKSCARQCCQQAGPTLDKHRDGSMARSQRPGRSSIPEPEKQDIEIRCL